MASKPGSSVKEMNDAAVFCLNQVLKKFKDMNKKYVDWV